MRIAIFGAGGIGGYLGGRLSQAGEEVVLIARGEHLRAIREHGLRVDSIKGDFVAAPALATDSPTEAGTVDAVILGVKAWQVVDAAKAMRPMIGPETFVVPMQNGVEAPAQLASVLGEKAVVVGLGGLISYIVGPGHILHAGGDPYVSFGESDDSASERTERLLQAFQNAGIKANIPSNIHAALWGKLAFMAPSSGVGSISRATSGQWRSVPGLWEMAQQEDDQQTRLEVARDIKPLQSTVEKVELASLLKGEDDPCDCFFSIHAGAGGTESCDWAEMLLRMYLRYFERNNYQVEEISQTLGEEAGIRSITLRVKGSYAFGYLSCETGVHRLVRISPFDSAKRRHTSFTAVDVIPDHGDREDIEILPEEIEMGNSGKEAWDNFLLAMKGGGK